jgi:hypothetical protein
MSGKLEKAVRMGLQLAEGQSMDQAVETMMECLGLVIDVGTAPSLPVTNSLPPPKPQSKAAVFSDDVPIEALKELAPISGVREPDESKGKVRIYWTLDELQAKILAETPTEMEVNVTDAGDTIRIFRKLAQQAGVAPGIQLGYGPQVPDPRIPFPKVSFWVTTEQIDLEAAVAEMRKSAASMYKVRAMPQTKLVADRPLRFSVGGEVE